MTLIQAQLKDRIGTLAFDHYAKRNALGADLIAEMLDNLDEFARQEVGAVVIRSASDQPVWSSGHDVDELPLADLDPIPYDEPLEMLLRAVKRFPAPVIAMVHGSVWGGSFDLVMACDIVLSDETGAFAITPAKLGLPYNTNGFLNFMSRAPLGIVKEMFFTADPISAERAPSASLVMAGLVRTAMSKMICTHLRRALGSRTRRPRKPWFGWATAAATTSASSVPISDIRSHKTCLCC